jgi:endonuclease III
MKRAERADRIGEILDDLYPRPPIPLHHTDPFSLLVAVMLSAQTTDKKVNEVTPALMRRAPTPGAMARLPVETIQSLIREIGLAPTKARNLQKTGRLLVERHAGVVPARMDALEALPGVGHKTACVVMAQAFGVPTFPVDTHIHRLAARWRLSDGSNVTKTEADLQRCFPEDTWNRRHLQIIYFGREHCPARHHDLGRCPICSWAASRRRIREESAVSPRPGVRPSESRSAPSRGRP